MVGLIETAPVTLHMREYLCSKVGGSSGGPTTTTIAEYRKCKVALL